MNKDLLTNLIKYDTCSGKTSEQAIDYIINYLQNFDFCSKKIKHKESYSLLSSLDLGKEKWVLFSGHIDTVPIGDINLWNNDPFTLYEDQDKYYGRGVCDMKGQISSILSLLPQAYKNSNYNIILALSCDEESELISINELIKETKEMINLKNIDLCIITEPTNNKIGISHDGVIIGDIEVQGISGHSSDPKNGVNSINYGIQAIEILKSKLDIFYKPNTVSSSLNIAKFQSGSAVNVIPGSAKISFSIRVSDYQKQDIIESLELVKNEIAILNKKIKNNNSSCFVKVNMKEVLPPFSSDNLNSSDIFNKIDKNNLNKINLRYGCEAGFWSKNNINTIVIGAGDISNTHIINECISKESLSEYEKIIIEAICS